MKVSSPIGDLPFEPQRLTINHDGVEITGVMGAWPAHVQVGVSDLPALARLLVKPIGVAVAIAVAIAVARGRPRRVHR